MAPLPSWAELEPVVPAIVATMQRYLQQIGCVLRPGSVGGADIALRSFAAFLAETAPEVTSVADVVRRHVEDYRPWLTARPGQNKPRVTPATIAHRLGTLRMFFLRIDEWGWPEAPARVPMLLGDLPRQDHPLPKALDDGAAAKLLRAAQNDRKPLVRVTVEVLLRTGLRGRRIHRTARRRRGADRRRTLAARARRQAARRPVPAPAPQPGRADRRVPSPLRARRSSAAATQAERHHT
jgi:hypothetical protein